MDKTVIYLRVSSKGQEENGYSLDAQEKLAREYAKQPLQYTVDEYGNFTNLTQTEETPAPEETQGQETPAA